MVNWNVKGKQPKEEIANSRDQDDKWVILLLNLLF